MRCAERLTGTSVSELSNCMFSLDACGRDWQIRTGWTPAGGTSSVCLRQPPSPKWKAFAPAGGTSSVCLWQPPSPKGKAHLLPMLITNLPFPHGEDVGPKERRMRSPRHEKRAGLLRPIRINKILRKHGIRKINIKALIRKVYLRWINITNKNLQTRI